MEVEMNKAWREENIRRVKQMSKWYYEDGRDKEDHPQHGLYTGLAAKYSEEQCKLPQPTPST